MSTESPAYLPLVREWPHGFYGGTRRVGSKRATVICRHCHETREAAEECAERLTALQGGA